MWDKESYERSSSEKDPLNASSNLERQTTILKTLSKQGKEGKVILYSNICRPRKGRGGEKVFFSIVCTIHVHTSFSQKKSSLVVAAHKCVIFRDVGKRKRIRFPPIWGREMT